MSYRNSRAIVAALHGGGQSATVPGLGPIRVAQHDPRPQPEFFYDDEGLGEGWGRPSVAIDASLFFGLEEDR